MSNRVMEAVVQALVLGIVMFSVSYLLNFIFAQNPTLSVGTSTQLNDNEYIVSMNIHTYSKDLKDVQLVIDTKLTQNQIKANQPLKIKIIDNNVGVDNRTMIEISHIPKEKHINLLIISDKQLVNEDIIINKNDTNLDTIFESEVVNPVNKQVKNIIVNSILYALIVGLINFYSNRGFNKKMLNAREEVIRVRDLYNVQVNKTMEVQEDIDRVKEKLEKNINNSMKKQILLQAKLNDYRKELNFWRNTVRKILYKLLDGDKKAEDLFKIVSSSLKTYQTNETNEHDFESLRVLSEMIKDIDEES